MSKASNLSKSQLLIKHILLWTVFGYCYQSAISLLIKMATDVQPSNVLITSLVYCLGFNVLAAHLITKYDKHWPVIGSIFIGLVGLVAIPFLLFGRSGLLAYHYLLEFYSVCRYVVMLLA